MDKVPDPLVKSDDKNLCNNLCKNLRCNLRCNLRSSLRCNLRKNLRSNIRSNLRKSFGKSLRNNLDLRTVSLISSNSHPFLHKLLTSSRRSSVEEDSKTSAVPKVATEVATSVIQTGSSRGGYREERVMQGGSGWNGTVTQTSTKKELPVSAAAINPITVATNMPANQPYDKTPC